MKLKYYLRGAGIGIIFATIVMTVSSFVHNNNLSDEYIMKEARKLGMVMKEELKEGGLWGDKDAEETETSQIEGSEVESSQMTENSDSEDVSESESQMQSETAPEPEPVPEPEPKPEPESQKPIVPQEPTTSDNDNQDVRYATIVIVRGDYARQVGEKLFAAGLIDDAEEFRKYMGVHGYAKSIHAGTYNIPFGSTYEEICKIVAG